ncbi:NUDIX hydrolase [Alsobacter sp. SYSU M60028]|uniref:NUDIX hydrolase n=1 Tax=Alsobacter ponti TaxID=2962936 RepID=A0ABT1LEF1_9HYPH|nr:NUDIX hydrolase [Alsobacter ponti]MCP8939869.1 NUDIX hydrolase [Alsobacter ponti]
MSEQTLIDRLNAEARERKWPNVRPRDAATLIVVDRSGRAPKLLMGRRHEGHKFMPGKFVFPGGRVEAGDRRMVAAGALEPKVEERLMARVLRPSASRARALALAAIRETFEETGLLLGTKEFGAPEGVPEGPWSEFAGHGVFPDLEALHFVARAITPPRRPKRFDTRFFAVDSRAIAGQVEGVVGPNTELVELCWVTTREAQKLDLPVITSVIINELVQRIEAGMPLWKPVPFFYERQRQFQREEL